MGRNWSTLLHLCTHTTLDLMKDLEGERFSEMFVAILKSCPEWDDFFLLFLSLFKNTSCLETLLITMINEVLITQKYRYFIINYGLIQLK